MTMKEAAFRVAFAGWATLALADERLLTPLPFKEISKTEVTVTTGDWTLLWNRASGTLLADRSSGGGHCRIIEGSALPNLSFWKVGSGNRVLIYGETVISDLRLVNLDTCGVLKSAPGPNTEITENGYWTPVSCGDSGYPHLMSNPSGPTDCDSAQVYKYDAKKQDFEADVAKSKSETEKETGVSFFGKAFIQDLGKPQVKLVEPRNVDGKGAIPEIALKFYHSLNQGDSTGVTGELEKMVTVYETAYEVIKDSCSPHYRKRVLAPGKELDQILSRLRGAIQGSPLTKVNEEYGTVGNGDCEHLWLFQMDERGLVNQITVDAADNAWSKNRTDFSLSVRKLR